MRWRWLAIYKRKVKYITITTSLLLLMHHDTAFSQSPVPRWHLYRNVQRDPINPTTYSNQPPEFDLKTVRTKVPMRIYVVDSGIKITHEEFQGRASYGWNVIDDSNIADDCQGHGTHVAALAAGKYSGVAKAADIISVKILDCLGVGYCSDVTTAMMWILDHHEKTSSPASVVIMSVGSSDKRCESTARAADEMAASGIIITAAAGNAAADACALFPAKNRATIAVGATDISDEVYSKSNFGDCVEIHAPGVKVLSAWGAGSNTTTLKSTGTSMSAPQAGATAALIKGANPNLTVSEVKDILLDSSTKDVIYKRGDRELVQASANRLLHTPWSRLFVDVEVDSDETDAIPDDNFNPTNNRVISTTRTSKRSRSSVNQTQNAIDENAALAIELDLKPDTYPAMKFAVDKITTALASVTNDVSLDNITAMRVAGTEVLSDGNEPRSAFLRFYVRVPSTKLDSLIQTYSHETRNDRLQEISGEKISFPPNAVLNAELVIRDRNEQNRKTASKVPLILGIIAGIVGGAALVGLVVWRVRARVLRRLQEERMQEIAEELVDNDVQFPQFPTTRIGSTDPGNEDGTSENAGEHTEDATIPQRDTIIQFPEYAMAEETITQE